MSETHLTEPQVLAIRQQKLQNIRKVKNPYPNDFKRDHWSQELLEQYSSYTAEQLAATPVACQVAGRIMLKRVMGQTTFIHIQDMKGRLQLYITKNQLGDEAYEAFRTWDIGDIVGAQGHLFKTKTEELTVRVSTIGLLVKALRPLPDKYHGLADTEQCYRKRYLDLTVNGQARQTFHIRCAVISMMRQYFDQKDFLEVETPMMHPIPGGASARPFKTYHNALKMELFLRIAPELYLKRLVVGGFERVYEINRNFRNEGISTQHNPEFTMLEFYQAYSTYQDLMVLIEHLLCQLAKNIHHASSITYQDQALSWEAPFHKISFLEAILVHNPALNRADLQSWAALKAYMNTQGIQCPPGASLAKAWLELFEQTVEHRLIEPTFVMDYPAEVSPLARVRDDDPNLAERFELFIMGREIANGFSELNDPELQAEKFKAQVMDRQAGDDEAMYFDEDYVTALEYGLPPTAGAGIGIDRLVMLLANAPSIRDVILFPTLKPKS